MTSSAMKKIMHRIREITPVGIRKRIGLMGDFLSYPNYPNVKATLEYLKKWGFSPLATIDVGASSGEWTKTFKAIYPSAKVLMIEAQDKMAPCLQGVCNEYPGDVFYETALLGATDGEQVQFVEAGSGSSVFEEHSSYERCYVQKSLVRLDSLLSGFPHFHKVDFLKLDVQGYELEVLKGGMQTVNSAEFVLMEASLIPINRGCPLVADVLSFMERINFRLLDFCGQYRRKDGALWQTDLLFVKKDSSFVPAASISPENW